MGHTTIFSGNDRKPHLDSCLVCSGHAKHWGWTQKTFLNHGFAGETGSHGKQMKTTPRSLEGVTCSAFAFDFIGSNSDPRLSGWQNQTILILVCIMVGTKNWKLYIYSLKLIYLEVWTFDGVTTTKIVQHKFQRETLVTVWNSTNLPTLFFPRRNVNLIICSSRGCHAPGCMASMKAPTGKGDKALFPPQSCESRSTEHFSQFSNRAFGSSGPKWPNGIFDNQIQANIFKRCYHKGF